MSLPHALLTALIEQSSSGSELARRFDRSIGLFWAATHQQIYRELGKLEDAGWVSSTPVEAARGGKKVYKVLSAGKRELKRWINASEDPKPQREQLMLRVRAEAVVGPTKLKEDIERRLSVHQQRVSLYREIEKRDFSHPDQTHQERLQHLILVAGIMTEDAWAQWSVKAIEVLRSEEQSRHAAAADD